MSASLEEVPQVVKSAEGWLTLDEVTERLRFKNRRALLHYLRTHPTNVYRLDGTSRYFMRIEDADAIMQPVHPSQVDNPPLAPGSTLTPVSVGRRRGRPPKDAPTFVPADVDARRRGRPRGARR